MVGNYPFVVFLNVTDFCYAASYLALLICWFWVFSLWLKLTRDNIYFSYHNWAVASSSWRFKLARNSKKLHFTFFVILAAILLSIIYFSIRNIEKGMLISIPSMYLFSLPVTLYFFVFEYSYFYSTNFRYFQFRSEIAIASRVGVQERNSIQENFHTKTRIALKRVGLLTILILISLIVRGGYVLNELLRYSSNDIKVRKIGSKLS